MTQADLLTLLRADLNILSPDLTRLAQLNHLIEAALQLIAREGVNITINAAPGMDVNALADAVAYKLQHMYERRRAVW